MKDQMTSEEIALKRFRLANQITDEYYYEFNKKLWNSSDKSILFDKLVEMIDDKIDHYSPYRPITDSDLMKGAREGLEKLKQSLKGGKSP